VLVQAPNERGESVDAVTIPRGLAFGWSRRASITHHCLAMRAKSVRPRLAPDAMHDAGVSGAVERFPLCNNPCIGQTA
jgi:hypothetical protein